MSISLMTLAWKADLPSGQKFVLLALCDHANDQGECFPSISMLVEKCGLSDRTIQRCITDMENIGILTRVMRDGRSTVYRIDARKFPQKPPDTASPHPRNCVTPERMSPPTPCHPTPDTMSPPPPKLCHPTPETVSPITIKEPSFETSSNHQDGANDVRRPDDLLFDDDQENPVKGKAKARKPKPKPEEEPLELPDWLPVVEWEVFVADRGESKHPMTRRAMKQAINQLATLREAGNDPKAVLQRSVVAGYRGLFPLPDDQKAPKKLNDSKPQSGTGVYSSAAGQGREDRATTGRNLANGERTRFMNSNLWKQAQAEGWNTPLVSEFSRREDLLLQSFARGKISAIEINFLPHEIDCIKSGHAPRLVMEIGTTARFPEDWENIIGLEVVHG